MQAFDLNRYIASRREQVNKVLHRYLPESNGQTEIVAAMNHSLHAGGKRLRPVLCIAACEAVGGRSEMVWPACCALEMVHTYSLIHDDLPAMDDDQLRRGRPTCHIAFSEATAILAGDALLTMAFEILASVPLENGDQAAQWLQVIRTIARAAGCRGMIQGQMLDMAAEGRRLDAGDLESMHRLKTGALIEASLHCGALLAQAEPAQLEDLQAYARNIGLAFQVADDILNVEGDPELMGKAVGTDRLNQKNTYPSLLGLEESKQLAQKLIRQALQALEAFDNKAEPLRALATYIITRRR